MSAYFRTAWKMRSVAMAFGRPLTRETKILSLSRGTSFKNKRFISAEKRRQKTGWIKSDFQTRKQKRVEV